MISKKDTKYLESLINKFSIKKNEKVNRFPLLEEGFTTQDIMRGIEVLLSRKLTMSEITKKFENTFAKYIGSKYALMVNSGSSANLLSAFALVNPKKESRLKPGDKFIIPAICWSTSLWPLVQCGLKPEFIDVNINNYCLDESLLKEKTKAKAIMNIHILGNSTNMDKLCNFVNSKKIYLIEDTCEALGSKFKSKYLGTFGTFATQSFHETKNVISGEGGALLINNPDLIDRAQIIREKGTNRSQFLRGQVDKYTWIDIGSSYLPGEITAAFLWAQLKKAKSITARRKELWKVYHEAFETLERAGRLRRPIIPLNCEHNAHMYYLLLHNLEDRTHFIKKMKKQGVNCVFHYVPLHSSTAGRKYGRVHGSMEVTERIASQLVRLPLWTEMGDSEFTFIRKTINKILQ